MMALILAFILACDPLQAQSVDPTRTAQPMFEAFSSPLDATDTAWIQLGHRDFTRYDTPSACVAAARLARKVAERNTVLDTAEYRPLQDSFPNAAVVVARTCGAHFSVATVSPSETRAMLQLALFRMDDIEAMAAAERYISTWSDVAGQAWAMVQVVHDLMDARPMRLTIAEGMVRRLDSLGRAVAVQRYIAHWDLWEHGLKGHKLPLMKREGKVLLAVRQLMTDEEKKDIYKHERSGSQSTALFSILVPLLGAERDRGATEQEAMLRVEQLETEAGVDVSEGRKLFALIKGTILEPFRLLGTKVPPLLAKWWFGTPGDTVWPTPGHVTILIRGDANSWNGCQRKCAMLRYLRQKFGAGLRIVLYTATTGWFHDGPPLTPAQEAEKIRWYFLDYLKLPLDALAIDETPILSRKPDGRIVRGQARYASEYYGQGFLVVGKDGTLLHNLFDSRSQADTMIARALGR